jgi:hypothetical protein
VIEYILEGGRIGHLSHEYSGRKQEKGILNTHIPTDAQCECEIVLEDGSDVIVSIRHDGAASFSGAGHVRMSQWDYKRTVLRQDEVPRSLVPGREINILRYYPFFTFNP